MPRSKCPCRCLFRGELLQRECGPDPSSHSRAKLRRQAECRNPMNSRRHFGHFITGVSCSTKAEDSLVCALGRERAEVIGANPRRRAGLRATRHAVAVIVLSRNSGGRHGHDTPAVRNGARRLVRIKRSRARWPCSLQNPIGRHDVRYLKRARRLERVEGQGRHRWRRRELVLHDLAKRRRTDRQANQHQ
jgi:hypothetical protein